MSRILPLSGHARRVGDDVRTEHILAPHHCDPSVDMGERCAFLFASLDPTFAARLRDGDILVAGRRFGAGSNVESGIEALLGAGIRAVIATSFCRSFVRCAFNNGLLVVAGPTDGIAEGEALDLTDSGGGDGVELRTPRRVIPCEPLPPFARTLLEAGGLVPYLRTHGSFGPALPGERF